MGGTFFAVGNFIAIVFVMVWMFVEATGGF
jgi:hypothetical protein